MSRTKNSIPTRLNPELVRIIQSTKGKYLLKGKNVSTQRITLGMARQYKKYPNLMKELEENIK